MLIIYRRHLYSDLQPYTCIFEKCAFSRTSFNTRKLWNAHLELDHNFGPAWESVKCPFCLESTESGKREILSHLARHLEDIAAAAIPQDVESDTESEYEHASASLSVSVYTDAEDQVVEHHSPLSRTPAQSHAGLVEKQETRAANNSMEKLAVTGVEPQQPEPVSHVSDHLEGRKVIPPRVGLLEPETAQSPQLLQEVSDPSVPLSAHAGDLVHAEDQNNEVESATVQSRGESADLNAETVDSEALPSQLIPSLAESVEQLNPLRSKDHVLSELQEPAASTDQQLPSIAGFNELSGNVKSEGDMTSVRDESLINLDRAISEKRLPRLLGSDIHDSQQIPPSYKCDIAGCTAAPFQTRYLLSSHLNTHSELRPHYCPVKGCPRGVDGKGFKFKNEMIRHGLVHSIPGYICPFCPDREHKYPRPDNLQR